MNGGLSLGNWKQASQVERTAKAKDQGNANTGEVCPGGDLDMQVREGPNCSESWTDLRPRRIFKKGENRMGTGCISAEGSADG